MVTPCMDVLHQLARTVNAKIGAHQGVKHSKPNMQKDIDALMCSLSDHEVYIYREGQVLDPDEKPVVDALSIGLAMLTHDGSNMSPL